MSKIKYTLYLKSNKLYLLNIYIFFLKKMSLIYNFKLKKNILSKKNTKFSVYKSPHVYKKAKDHYQTIWYFESINIFNLTDSKLLEQILKNKPLEISCKIFYKF